MRRLSTASFVPFAMESFQAGATALGQNSSHSNTTTAVLELDETAPDSSRGKSEAPSVRCEPTAADYRLFLRGERLGEFAASERTPKPAADPHQLVGTWRLVSSEATVVDDGITEVTFTENPKGYLILTPWERMMTVCIGGDGERKKIPTSQADLSELWRTMLAYTGKYRVEGNELVTTVDVSWYELWTGTEQRRRFTLESDTLTIVTKPQPLGAGRRAKAMVSFKVVWERDN
jgi:lipocalin-like protein